MLATTANPSPTTWPVSRKQPAPVWTAARPSASTIATCRRSRPGSPARSSSRTSGALRPARILSRPNAPYEPSVKPWVATAPTPASAHGTSAPIENQWDWTATPSSPVAGSRATIE